MAKLIITEGGRDKIYEIVDDVFTIGSGESADLQLRSSEVASSHLQVQKVRNGFRIVDLETKSGTMVNGAQVNEHILTNGDTVELGDVKITYIGKGPARAGATAAAKNKGPKLDSSKYYRHAKPKPNSSAANAAIICSIIGGVLLLGFLMLKGSDAPSDTISAELRGLIKDSEMSEDKFRELERTVLKYERRRNDLDAKQRETLAKAKDAIKLRKDTYENVRLSREANALWVSIKNTSQFEPNNVPKITKLCNEYLANYSAVSKEKLANVKRILSETEKKGDMTPEQTELARIQGEIRRLMKDRDLKQAMKALEGMDRTAKAVYAEEYDKLYDKIRSKSRQYLGVRKNEVRFHLREGTGDNGKVWTPDPSKAREYAVNMIFDKLVLSTVEDYLRSPDKYREDINMRAELKTRELLKELVAYYKKQ